MNKGVSNQKKLEGINAEIDGPGTSYLDQPVMDNVLDTLVEMSATIWALQDRQIILEKVLSDKGVEVTELIEQYVPSEEEISERRHQREELINRMFGRFLRSVETGDSSVDRQG